MFRRKPWINFWLPKLAQMVDPSHIQQTVFANQKKWHKNNFKLENLLTSLHASLLTILLTSLHNFKTLSLDPFKFAAYLQQS